MLCPRCGKDSWKVKSSYRLKKSGFIIRNRKCQHCSYVLKTIEIPKKDFDSVKNLVNDFRDTVNKFLRNKPKYM